MKSVFPRCLPAFVFAFVLLSIAAAGTASPADSPSSAPAEYAYELSIDGARAETIRLSLRFKPLEKPARWDLPGIPGRDARRKAVTDVRCGGALLRHADEGGWASPAGCSDLSWTVKVKKRSCMGYDVPSQEAVRDPAASWIFLPAASFLLGSDDAVTPALIRIDSPPDLKLTHSPDSAGPSLVRLPSGGMSALAILAAGHFTKKEIEADGVRLRYVFDREPKSDFVRLARRHASAMSRLAKIAGNSWKSPETVFWFKKSRLSLRTGGAAAYRSICVNYRDRIDPESRDVKSGDPLLTVLHEEFHLLSPPSTPAWLSEGLAQYYAAKVLYGPATPGDAGFEKILDRLSGPFDPSQSLLELQRRINAAQDMNDYRKLYSLGVHFWRRADEIIARYSGGRDSLDGIVSDLLKVILSPGGVPPPAFREILFRAGGEAAGRLFDNVVMGRKAA